MRARALVLALALGLTAAFLTRGAGPVQSPPRAPERPPSPVRETAPTPASFEHVTRDPFHYLDDTEPSVRSEATSVRPEPEASPAPPLRLVGLIRQGGLLRAALSIHGVAVTAAAGESVEGYEVLSVDDDAGVRLKDAGGTEVLLVPE